MERDEPRVGVALGGGAVLGAAHIGVLRALEEHQIHIHCITGTSAGAFIGALYAFGVPISQMQGIVEHLRWLHVSRFNPTRWGLMTNDRMGQVVLRVTGALTFARAQVPCAFIATDVCTGEKVVLRSGKVSRAVMASACIPGIFAPVRIEGRLLVDGGLVESVPLSALPQLGAGFFLGVDLNSNRSFREPDDMVDVIANALDIANMNASRRLDERAHLVIAPELSAFSRASTHSIPELIRQGYEAALARMPALQARLREHAHQSQQR